MFSVAFDKINCRLVVIFIMLFVLVPFTVTPVIAQQGTESLEEEGSTVYKPMPIPEWEPAYTDQNQNHPIHYDISTGEEIVSEPLVDIPKSNTATSSGRMPEISINKIEGVTTINSFTDLTLVDNPTSYPWRVNVKLFMQFIDDENDTNRYVCSGVLIDPKHVLTAGHCIFSHDNGEGWADSIRVVAAYNDGNEPYGDADAINLYSWYGWIYNRDYDWDMGYIELDRPIGALVGWHGYGFNNYDGFFENNIFRNPGYPSEYPYDGESLYYWYGYYDYINTYTLYHDRGGYGGQSGSGAYYKNEDDERYVYAIHSHTKFLYGYKFSGHIRINSDKFYSIEDEIADNTPTSCDLVALDMNALPATIIAGNGFSNLNFLVYNNSSTSCSGRVNFDVYLSTNDMISSNDTWIGGSSFYNTFSPKESFRVDSPLYDISDTVDSGVYWIGVILDSADVDDSNNATQDWDASRINVIAGNTAPTISNLPDQVLPMDDVIDNAIDLWDYAHDPESSDSELTFTIDNAPDTNAGVSLDSNRYIDINPDRGWMGQTDVIIRVTDPEGESDTDTFNVEVESPWDKTWNGNHSDNWHTPDNWTPPGVPSIGDEVLIMNQTNSPVIRQNDVAVRSLTINQGAVLNLTNRMLTVEDILINKGTLMQTQNVAEGDTTEFLRITNQAGTQTKYYGVDVTPSMDMVGAITESITPESPRALVSKTGLNPAVMPFSQTQSHIKQPSVGISNGDFEGGSTGWVEYSTHGLDLIVTQIPTSIVPHSGNWVTWLGGDYDDTSYIQQQVTVPSQNPLLSYWYWIASVDACGYDVGSVIVNETTVIDQYDLCDSEDTNGWVQSTLNLSQYAGQSISLRIQAETDGSLNSNWFIDDVSLSGTSSPTAPPFCDGFETGTLGPAWATYTTNDGRVQVSSSYPYSGTYSVLLDDSVDDSTDSYAAIILPIDLAGQSQVELDFWWREFGDENDADDGVFISDNAGTDWYQVLSFNDGPSTYRNDVIDLDAAAAASGLTLNDHFQIKFQFYDDYSIDSDGYAIDEVCVKIPLAPDIAISPTTFEETLPQNTRVTRTLTIDNDGTGDLTFRIGEQAGASLLAQRTGRVYAEPLWSGKDIRATNSALTELTVAPSLAQSRHAPFIAATPAQASVSAFGIELASQNLVFFHLDNPNTLVHIGHIGSGRYYGGDFLGDDLTFMYVLDEESHSLITLDTATGISATIGATSPISGHLWSGIGGDPTSDTLYSASTNGSESMLYTIEETTGAAMVVGEITNAPGIIAMAINAAGEIYGLDIANDTLVHINKTTGTGTVIGSVGFDASYAQGMDFDKETGGLYLAAFNKDTLSAELRIADTRTGDSTVIASFPVSTEIDALSITSGGTANGVPWLSEIPTDDVVPTGDSISVDVVLNTMGLAPGDYAADLLISSNDLDENPVIVPVTLHVTPASTGPDIEIMPTSFEETLAKDTQVTRTLTISNPGTDSLLFSIVDGNAAWLEEAPRSGIVAAGGAASIDVIFDATGLTSGDYTTDLTISNNDPDENPVTVPIVMHIAPESNTPPMISIPDVMVPLGSVYQPIDLWRYASDTESSSGELTYRIANTPDPQANVRIDSNRYVAINPDWSGQTSVTIRVTDPGGLSDTDSFMISVLSSGPDIALSPSAFEVTLDQNTQLNTTLVISNVGSQDLLFAISDGEVDWLAEAPHNGILNPNVAALIDITFDTTGLAHGNYTTDLVISTNDPDENPVTIPVILHVELPGGNPDIAITPTSFETTLDQDTQVTRTLAIQNVGSRDLLFAINDGGTGWLTITPDSGTVTPNNTASLSVNFNAAGLTLGDYTADLIISTNDPDENPVTIPITLHVQLSSGNPDIAITPTSFEEILDQNMQLARTLTIQNVGEQDLMFTIDEGGVAWLTVTPDNGTLVPTATTRVNINFNTSGLTPGDYTTNLVISSNDPDENPVRVPVRLHIASAGVDVTVSVSGNRFCEDMSDGVRRCFDVEAATTINATLRFYFSEAERNGQIMNDLRVWHYQDIWMKWREVAGPCRFGDLGGKQYYVEVENIEDFSPFAVDICANCEYPTNINTIYLPFIIKG